MAYGHEKGCWCPSCKEEYMEKTRRAIKRIMTKMFKDINKLIESEEGNGCDR